MKFIHLFTGQECFFMLLCSLVHVLLAHVCEIHLQVHLNVFVCKCVVCQSPTCAPSCSFGYNNVDVMSALTTRRWDLLASFSLSLLLLSLHLSLTVHCDMPFSLVVHMHHDWHGCLLFAKDKISRRPLFSLILIPGKSSVCPQSVWEDTEWETEWDIWCEKERHGGKGLKEWLKLENSHVKGSKAVDTNPRVREGWREIWRDIGHDKERCWSWTCILKELNERRGKAEERH